MEWIRFDENDSTTWPNDGEQVLIYPQVGGEMGAVFNFVHKCWDDYTGDDYMCHWDHIKFWCRIPKFPKL